MAPADRQKTFTTVSIAIITAANLSLNHVEEFADLVARCWDATMFANGCGHSKWLEDPGSATAVASH